MTSIVSKRDWSAWLRGPGRRLRPSASGWWLIGITLAVGFAAINTNNNLLFFAWGLLLSVIVISGVLSEQTVRHLHLEQVVGMECRAGQTCAVSVTLHNQGRWPSYAWDIHLDMERDESRGPQTPPQATKHDTRTRTRTGFVLELQRHMRTSLSLGFDANVRGRYRVAMCTVTTGAPFGFFRKERFSSATHLPSVRVHPRRMAVDAAMHALQQRLGTASNARVGDGEEFHGVRAWREGDEERRTLWRKYAQSGRRYVREHESAASRELWLMLATSRIDDVDANEHALAVLASLAERLLHEGHAVGVLAPGIRIAPSRNAKQRLHILDGVTDLQWTDAEPAHAQHHPLVVVVAAGATAPAGAEWVVQATQVAAL
jgi:uncharacterized protein (DUF58 family)